MAAGWEPAKLGRNSSYPTTSKVLTGSSLLQSTCSQKGETRGFRAGFTRKQEDAKLQVTGPAQSPHCEALLIHAHSNTLVLEVDSVLQKYLTFLPLGYMFGFNDYQGK